MKCPWRDECVLTTNPPFPGGLRVFVHGHTYQGSPSGCAAALEVQRIVREEGLVRNVREMGTLLGRRLNEALGGHPNVGDIRGRGLFWGIEFVADKETKEPFPVQDHVAMSLAELGLTERYCIGVYPGGGSADGVRGDHIIISPAYNVGVAEIETIVNIVARLIGDFFAAHNAN